MTGIKDKIKWVAKEQLESNKPGLIVCFLETITAGDLNELKSNSALQYMSSYILSKSEHEHVAALIFCGEEEFTSQGAVVNSDAKCVTFRNPNCVFEQVKDFPFI